MNLCIKTPAFPAFPVFGYFFVTCICVTTKYMKFKRLLKKCLFQSCSSMLLQSFLSKGKKSKSIRVWLVAILRDNMWIDSVRANVLLLLSFLIETCQFRWLSWRRSTKCKSHWWRNLKIWSSALLHNVGSQERLLSCLIVSAPWECERI